MDPTMEFALSGLNMEFAAEFVEDRNDIPDLLFVDIITEKCMWIRDHIRGYRTCLILVANIGCKVATIKLFDKNKIDSQLLHLTISNIGDLESQLYRLWIEVTSILRDYIDSGHLLA